MLKKNQTIKLKYKKALIKLQINSSRQFNAGRQLKYNVQPDWSNQIITVYLIGQFKPVKRYDIISLVKTANQFISEMISYHFTGIIFIHSFITLISTHNM